MEQQKQKTKEENNSQDNSAAEKENYQTWVTTKYILLTLLYAEPKQTNKKCEYQEQNKLKQTTVKQDKRKGNLTKSIITYKEKQTNKHRHTHANGSKEQKNIFFDRFESQY